MEQKSFSEKISELLKEKNALKCPACGEENSAVFDGIFARALNAGRAIPCAVVVCKNCGAIREHVVDPLGIKVVTNNQNQNRNQQFHTKIHARLNQGLQRLVDFRRFNF